MSHQTRPCTECNYWVQWDNQPYDDITLGDCHRHAPILIEKQSADSPPHSGRLSTKWPATKDTDFCGSFKRRKSEDEQEGEKGE